MTDPIHRRVEGCLLDWMVPQADVDWWESRKRAYVEAGRREEAPEGDWPGMKAESPAPWDSSITLHWEIEGIDLARNLYPMHLEAVAADGSSIDGRKLGYFASQAEARLFAAALISMREQPPFDDALAEAGFSLQRTIAEYAMWERRLKSGDLSLKIVQKRERGPRRYDRGMYLAYEGDRARSTVPIVYLEPTLIPSEAVGSTQVIHPTTGVVTDHFVADLVASAAVAEARLALGNIRKPLADGQEVAIIQDLVALRDAARENLPSGI